jgi:hypothetical protein
MKQAHSKTAKQALAKEAMQNYPLTFLKTEYPTERATARSSVCLQFDLYRTALMISLSAAACITEGKLPTDVVELLPKTMKPTPKDWRS